MSPLQCDCDLAKDTSEHETKRRIRDAKRVHLWRIVVSCLWSRKEKEGAMRCEVRDREFGGVNSSLLGKGRMGGSR